MRSVRLFGALAASIISSSVLAEIRYQIEPASSRDRVTVRMEFTTTSPITELQMPSWSPGLYVLENYWKSLTEVSVTDQEGNPVTVSHGKPDTWSFSTPVGKKVRVSYARDAKPETDRLSMFSSDPTSLHLVGPKIYLYVAGRKEEECRLDAQIPEGWQIAIGLNPIKSEPGFQSFRAKNFDVLADNPITLGDFLLNSYRVQNKEHQIAFRGTSKSKVDRDKVVRMAEFVSKSQADFMGGLPYNRYVWHFWVNEMPDGSGGVEHASSTHMFLGKGAGPAALIGMAHESFHLWNVKRIRSFPLGPFDYSQLPKTGALWWLEGVTDYYAHVLPFRYGAWSREAFLGDAADIIDGFRSSPGRLVASPYESSYRIPEANNSNGYKISYYVNGWVLGLMFDLELRSRSNGKRSLDDVEHALWQLCKDDKPGFQEEEIRRQLIRFGGASMGDLYDEWVMKPGNLPIEAQLAKVGLALEERKEGNRLRPFLSPLPDATVAQVKLRDGWLRQKPIKGAITFAR